MNELLIMSIKLLAASSSEQREYLVGSGLFPCTDEIALLFDDAYKSLNKQECASFSAPMCEKLSEINKILDELSDLEDKSNWNEKSLDNNYWSLLRKTATSILNDMEKAF